jgi:hypothetical protein
MAYTLKEDDDDDEEPNYRIELQGGSPSELLSF